MKLKVIFTAITHIFVCLFFGLDMQILDQASEKLRDLASMILVENYKTAYLSVYKD